MTTFLLVESSQPRSSVVRVSAAIVEGLHSFFVAEGLEVVDKLLAAATGFEVLVLVVVFTGHLVSQAEHTD